MAEVKRRRTSLVPAEDAVFSPGEIAEFIGNAFTAAVNPVVGTAPRMSYCRNFAQALVERLEAQDVQTGHMSHTEAVAMLLGAALAMHGVHCTGDQSEL